MSDQSQGPGWWVASDGKWYPPAGAPVAGGAPATPPQKGSTPLLLGLGALVAVLVAAAVVFAATRPKTDTAATQTPTTTAAGSSGANATSTTEAVGGKSTTTAKGKTSTTKGATSGSADFPPPKDPAGAIREAGLPELDEEGSFVHYHSHLDVIINGESVAVASQVGIARTTISPLHTHDESGIVHIEAEEDQAFTTKQFFTQWEVELSKDCIGDFCADDEHQLLGFVNGEQVDDPSGIVFGEHDEVVIWYGSASDSADIPTSYEFPDGL